MTRASAPGKVILVGEHAVVYGRPAIAAPVWQAVATATVTPGPKDSGCTLIARDLGTVVELASAPADDPLALAARLVFRELGFAQAPDRQVELTSTIPIASGMGSGAALCAALVRALFQHAGRVVHANTVSDIVFASEQIFHGTPSGIDNTVIAHGVPIWFVKGQAPEPFVATEPFMLAIADSGIKSPTRETVGDVRRGWEHPSLAIRRLCLMRSARLVHRVRRVLEDRDLAQLGSLLDANQEILAELGVSSAPLERLIDGARTAGAQGAKLSGGGRGGNVIALVDKDSVENVCAALRGAGAVQVIVTTIGGSTGERA